MNVHRFGLIYIAINKGKFNPDKLLLIIKVFYYIVLPRGFPGRQKRNKSAKP